MTSACPRSKTPTFCPPRRLPPPCWWPWTAARATSSSPTVPPRRLRWWPTPTSSCWTFGGGEGDFAVSDEEINIGISLKKGNTALKDAINEVLSTMTTDDYNAMMDQAIEAQPLNQG